MTGLTLASAGVSRSLPTVSVAMCTFNGRRWLDAQLDSILASLGDDDELVIVDDASSDGTWSMLQALTDPRVRTLRNRANCGVVASFERALCAARAPIVLLADQDDVWERDKRDAMLAAFDDDPSVTGVVSDATLIDADGVSIGDSFMATRGGFAGTLGATLLRSRFLGCAMGVRRSVLDLALPIPARAPMHDMWLGVIAASLGRVAYVDRPLLRYRRHDANASPARSPSPLRALRWRLDLVSALAARRLVGRSAGPRSTPESGE